MAEAAGQTALRTLRDAVVASRHGGGNAPVRVGKQQDLLPLST